MTGPGRYDVVVVGAGVSGCAIAYELAPDHDVLVVDKGQVAGEASGLAAGLIAPTLFYSDYPDVARHANPFFRTFSGTGSFEFNERPRIELIPPDKQDAGRKMAERLADEGFPVSFHDAAAAAERYPRFDFSAYPGIVEYRDAGWLDPYTYTTALGEAARERGAAFRTDVAVEGFDVESGAVVGVETDEGTVGADHVVVASGWRTAALLSEFASVPVVPFKLQCLTLDPAFDLDDGFPLGRVASEEIYFRPEHNGTVLFGGGEYVEERPESIVTGGGIDESFRNHVARTVPTFLNGFDDASVVRGWSGVDAATPDALPILDAPDALPDGMAVAAGFNGLGMVNSPVTATAVRSLLTGESCPFSLSTFALDRFDPDADGIEKFGTFEAAGV
ncbi:MAG: NAD(P)/FAD-dependent oxidoreductase [Haloarculaceae archaeon]